MRWTGGAEHSCQIYFNPRAATRARYPVRHHGFASGLLTWSGTIGSRQSRIAVDRTAWFFRVAAAILRRINDFHSGTTITHEAHLSKGRCHHRWLPLQRSRQWRKAGLAYGADGSRRQSGHRYRARSREGDLGLLRHQPGWGCAGDVEVERTGEIRRHADQPLGNRDLPVVVAGMGGVG